MANIMKKWDFFNLMDKSISNESFIISTLLQIIYFFKLSFK